VLETTSPSLASTHSLLRPVDHRLLGHVAIRRSRASPHDVVK